MREAGAVLNMGHCRTMWGFFGDGHPTCLFAKSHVYLKGVFVHAPLPDRWALGYGLN